MAADSTVGGYSEPGGAVQTEVSDPGSSAANSPSLTEKLPFTGQDTIFLAAVGIALLGLGLGLRRLGSGSQSVS